MHPARVACTPVVQRTWQTLGVNILAYLLHFLGFRFRMRRHGLAMRLRHLFTLAIVMGGVGTALGYTVVRRGRVDDEVDEVETTHAGSAG